MAKANDNYVAIYRCKKRHESVRETFHAESDIEAAEIANRRFATGQWYRLEPLAAIREPLDYDKGLDVIDSRTGETLAWRGSMSSETAPHYDMEATWTVATELRDKLNETYPNRDIAPAHDTLVHEIVGWRIQGLAG